MALDDDIRSGVSCKDIPSPYAWLFFQPTTILLRPKGGNKGYIYCLK
jgi:hypothetical protein